MDFRSILSNAKKQLNEYASDAVNEITQICNEFGPRPCGEEGEKKAQEFMGEMLKKYSDDVKRETFNVHPEAFMAFVPIAAGLLLGSTAINLSSALKNKKTAAASFPLLGAAVGALAGEFFIYKKPLDPLFKKKESGNIVAVRKATGETKKRIIISGHTDSAPEWTYTYHLGSKGVTSLCAYAIGGLAYDIASSVVGVASKNSKLKKGLAFGQLAFLPAFAGLFAFTNNKRYVHGANDDLTGCYIANSVLKFLSDNDIKFENTEVIALLTGGEECGLRGCEAFFKAHPEMLNDGTETIFVGFDTIRDEEYREIYTADLNGLVKTDMKTCELLKDAAKKSGVDIPFGSIPLGSTDAAAAARAGCKATSMVAMDPAPARYYHTRLDTPDILVPETIEKTIEIALQTVFDFDEKGLGD